MPIARYIDWITTTPILMYELGHLAHASTADTLMLVGYAARTALVPTTYTTYYHLTAYGTIYHLLLTAS